MNATGWHRHGASPNAVWPDTEFRNPCGTDSRPVLVVDPVTARDNIARALHQHDEVLRRMRWERLFDEEQRMYLTAADAVLAALKETP